jgi:hypothetical protein
MRPSALILLPLLVAGSLAMASAPLTNQNLRWSPTTKISELNLGGLNLTTFEGKTLAVVPFTDGRANPALIGENREDEDSGKVLPVTTKDAVPEFITTQSKEFLKGLGLPVAESAGKVQLTGEVLSFFVTETSTYKGDVRIKVQVKAEGQTLWSGLAIGSAKRFGRSYRMDNYNEVLCDALLDAWAGLVRNPEFLKALAGGR